jgi:hypothetical protein
MGGRQREINGRKKDVLTSKLIDSGLTASQFD